MAGRRRHSTGHVAAEDLRRVDAFVRQCYGQLDPDAFVEVVLDGLPRIVASELTTYNEMNVVTRTSRDRSTPADVASPERVRIWNAVMHQHPVLMHVARTGDGRAHKISDFLPVSAFHRLALHGEHFKPQRVEDMMGIALAVAPDVVVGIAVHRARRSFTDRDRAMLDLVRPHVTQAYRNAQSWYQATQALAAIDTALDALGQSIVVLTPARRVKAAGGQGVRWIAEYFGVPCRGGRLPDALDQWVRAEQASRWPAAAGARVPLVVDRGESHLVIRVVVEADRVLMLLAEHDRRSMSQALVASGLRPREVDVLIWVSRGRSNPEIAEILGMSPRTVEKHLESIFRKLGVENRTAAALTASRLAGRAAF